MCIELCCSTSVWQTVCRCSFPFLHGGQWLDGVVETMAFGDGVDNGWMVCLVKVWTMVGWCGGDNGWMVCLVIVWTMVGWCGGDNGWMVCLVIVWTMVGWCVW